MRTCLLVCVALLAAPVGAQADSRIDHMARKAQAHFGLSCLQASTTKFPWGQVGESDLPDCRIEVTSERLSRKDTCLIVFHEAGHKAGLGHSQNPASIMFRRPLEVHYQPCLRYDLLELRLCNLREDLDIAQRFDHDRHETRRLLRAIRRTKRVLGP